MLHLEADTLVLYKFHEESIHDKSTYVNAHAYVFPRPAPGAPDLDEDGADAAPGTA